MVAFVVFGFTAQLLLVGFFAAYRWRPAYMTRLGRLVYGMGLVAAALAAGFIVVGQPWYLVMALLLYTVWAAFGWLVDIARPVPWRRPPKWSILIPVRDPSHRQPVRALGAALVRRSTPLDRLRSAVCGIHDPEHHVAYRRSR